MRWCPLRASSGVRQTPRRHLIGPIGYEVHLSRSIRTEAGNQSLECCGPEGMCPERWWKKQTLSLVLVKDLNLNSWWVIRRA